MGKLEKQNNVFHLEVQAYNNSFGDLVERDSYYSGVYSTIEKAIEEGKWFIDRRFKEIYQQSDYCTNEKDTSSLEDMLKDDVISYCFKITELDPTYADSFEPPKREYMCRDLKPTHTTYFYDYKGNLKYYDLEYLDKDGGWGYTTVRYENDDESKPNKFNVGDFVTVIDDEVPADQVFVVSNAPIRNDPKRFFDNTYCLSTISDGCRFSFYHDYNECQIKKYDGTIDSNSPFILLQKFYRGEIDIDDNILRKIEDGDILLNTKPTYLDIPELKALLSKGNENKDMFKSKNN